MPIADLWVWFQRSEIENEASRGSDKMSMLDVARFLSYSKSIDHSSDNDRYFSLAMANSGRLFSCLHGDRAHWSFGREQDAPEQLPKLGKGV